MVVIPSSSFFHCITDDTVDAKPIVTPSASEYTEDVEEQQLGVSPPMLAPGAVQLCSDSLPIDGAQSGDHPALRKPEDNVVIVIGDGDDDVIVLGEKLTLTEARPKVSETKRSSDKTKGTSPKVTLTQSGNTLSDVKDAAPSCVSPPPTAMEDETNDAEVAAILDRGDDGELPASESRPTSRSLLEDNSDLNSEPPSPLAAVEENPRNLSLEGNRGDAEIGEIPPLDGENGRLSVMSHSLLEEEESDMDCGSPADVMMSRCVSYLADHGWQSVCCVSGMFIPDPNFSNPNLGSRFKKIPDPVSGAASKNINIFNPKNRS
jgi:hypothetical protein